MVDEGDAFEKEVDENYWRELRARRRGGKQQQHGDSRIRKVCIKDYYAVKYGKERGKVEFEKAFGVRSKYEDWQTDFIDTCTTQQEKTNGEI